MSESYYYRITPTGRLVGPFNTTSEVLLSLEKSVGGFTFNRFNRSSQLPSEVILLQDRESSEDPVELDFS